MCPPTQTVSFSASPAFRNNARGRSSERDGCFKKHHDPHVAMILLLLPLLLWGSSLRSGRGTRSGGKHALNSTHKKHTKDTKNKNKNSAWTTRINKQRQRQRDCQHNKPSTATATTTTSSDHTTQHTRGQQRRTKNKAREKATTDQTNNKVSIATQGAHAGNQKIFHCHSRSTRTSPFLANYLAAPVSVSVQRNMICFKSTSLPSPRTL